MTSKQPRCRPFGRERPLVTIVTMDAAYSGPSGLAVGSLQEDSGGELRTDAYWQGDARTHECFRWLGTEVARRTPAGTRAVFVVESDAFGPSVARKLGIAIGAVEGLLIDCNAVLPDTRRDVSQSVWRRSVLGKSLPKGRAALKAAAVAWAVAHYPGFDPTQVDAAEALCLLHYARKQYSFGEVLP